MSVLYCFLKSFAFRRISFFFGKEGLPLESRDKAFVAAKAAQDKKAKDVIVLDLHGITTIADFFVICSGESTPQVKAIEEHVESKLAEHGAGLLRIEGLRYCNWVLMDYGDVIIHIFEDEMRAFYELEKLWIDARRIDPDSHTAL